MKRNLPKDESWRLNKGIGGHAHYDRDEMVREFDKKMQMHLDKLDQAPIITEDLEAKRNEKLRQQNEAQDDKIKSVSAD